MSQYCLFIYQNFLFWVSKFGHNMRLRWAKGVCCDVIWLNAHVLWAERSLLQGFFLWLGGQNLIHNITRVMQHSAYIARCRWLSLKVLLIHLLLKLEVLMHYVIKRLLKSSNLLLKSVSTFHSGRKLVKWEIYTTWHDGVIFKNTWCTHLTASSFKHRAVYIKLVFFSLDDLIPLSTLYLSCALLLIFKILHTRNLSTFLSICRELFLFNLCLKLLVFFHHLVWSWSIIWQFSQMISNRFLVYWRFFAADNSTNIIARLVRICIASFRLVTL